MAENIKCCCCGDDADGKAGGKHYCMDCFKEVSYGHVPRATPPRATIGTPNPRVEASESTYHGDGEW